MPEIHPVHVPSPRCVIGWDGTAYRACAVDASGHLQVDALSSALPAGAATAANQVTEITALQLIDDLRNALQSVATDRLKVRGENQLFSLKDNYLEQVVDLNAPVVVAGLNGTPVPAGEWWIVNSIHAYDSDTVVTRIEIGVRRGAVTYLVNTIFPTVVRQPAVFAGSLVLKTGDYVRAYFVGTVLNDDISLNIVGYKMTVEV